MAFLNLEVLGKQVSPAENESLFGMFSLRWSRACLGNMIIFSITWRKRYACFAPASSQRSRIQRSQLLQENTQTSILRAFPVFVPSLSW